MEAPIDTTETIVRALGAKGIAAGDGAAGGQGGQRIGRALLADASLVEFGPDLARSIGAALGKVHGITPATDRTLSFLPVPLLPPARAEIGRLRQALDRVADPRPALEYVLCWLEERAPAAGPLCLVHGAFHADKIVVAKRTMTAISDWGGAHWGDPREDVGAFIARFARGGNDDKVAGGLAKFAIFLEGYNGTAPQKVAAPEVQYWEIFAAVSAGVHSAVRGDLAASAVAKDGGRDVAALLAGLRVPELELDAMLGIEAFEKGKR